MKFRITLVLLFIFSCIASLSAQTISREELITLTPEWKGERFPDGRPKVEESLITRAKKIGLDDAWTVLKNLGYTNQFESGFKRVNDLVIAGRAVTAAFIPTRPDLEKAIKDRGAKQGRVGNTNIWPIEGLTRGDLYVADGFGKIRGGTLMGSTLGNSIFAKTGTGVVFDASARDVDGLADIQGMNSYVRDWDPSFLEGTVLSGLNTPIRIGGAVVMPGDLVIAGRIGVLFIPAHLAEQVVSTAEFVMTMDQFKFEMVRTQKFKTGEMDAQWTDPIKEAFIAWLAANPQQPRFTRQQIDEFMRNRTW